MKHKNDFRDFMQIRSSPSLDLDRKILSFISTDLNPAHKKVFLKLTLIQAFVGILTMLFCPQFNFSLTRNYDLFHFFHINFGHQICMIICGCIFLGSGTIFANFILSDGEINTIRRSRFLYYLALSIIAVSVFMLLGAKFYLNLLSFWMLGAIGGGMLFFELNYLIHKNLAQLQA